MFGRSATRFTLRHHATLSPPGVGFEIASFDIGPAGEAVVLWTHDAQTAVSIEAPETSSRVVRVEMVPELAGVQPLPDGRLLMVGARAEWRESGPDRNAVVCAPDGRVERSACLGDDIGHVQTAADGTVWVGYGDEGIFGNFGWGGPGPAPIGARGIVQFSPSLDVVWEYPRSAASDPEPIDDCYALNVAGEAVWACCYSSFDVVRIRDGAVRSWSNEVAGAWAIVASGDSVALFGGYADRDRLAVGSLSQDELEVDAANRLTMPNGRRLPQDAVVVGRGEDLHVLVGLEWFTWSLTDHT